MGKDWRFVVLRHGGNGVDREHFDLMIQVPGQEKLWTWRVYEELEAWGIETKAERIADHRASYMTYQGEVSGGRGTVRRVGEGTAVILEEDESRLRMRMTGADFDCEMFLPKLGTA